MPKFENVVTIEVAPGRRDEMLRFLAAHKARCLKNEPGPWNSKSCCLKTTIRKFFRTRCIGMRPPSERIGNGP
jgi:hypothetical protein